MHHSLEFVKIDCTISICIHLVNHLVPNFLIDVFANSHSLLNFIDWDGATSIFVVKFERHLQLVFLEKLPSVHCRGNEFREVDSSTVVCVSCLEDTLYFIFWERFTKEFVVHSKELFVLQFSITVDIEPLEDLLKLCCLFFTGHILHHNWHCRLLKFIAGLKTFQTVKGIQLLFNLFKLSFNIRIFLFLFIVIRFFFIFFIFFIIFMRIL